MITKQELNTNNVTLLPPGKLAFTRLYLKINEVRRAYGRPMVVTSGVRSYLDQLRIDRKAGRKPTYNSAHLKGAAVDIADSTGQLKDWALANLALMQSLGIFLEDFRYTGNWVHFQVISPVSGHRIFIPYAQTIAPFPARWDGAYDHEKYDLKVT